MGKALDEQDKEVLKAVEEYVYDRHNDLSTSNVVGFSPDELDSIKTEKGGHLVFTVEDVQIKEKLVEDDTTVWYVAATLYFDTNTDGERIEGSTDIYECYQCMDAIKNKPAWYVDWHSS